MLTRNARPVYLDLLHIRQPITAVTSLLHRISGVVLSLSLPALIYLLQRSLAGPDAYAQVLGLWDSLPVRAIAVVLTWALLHHLFAGIRFLILDLHIGTKLQQARASAWSASLAGLAGLVVAVLVLLP